MGLWADIVRNKAMRDGRGNNAQQSGGGGGGSWGPNDVAIQKENEMFPNFSAVADAFAGKADSPRFGNFSAFVNMFPERFQSWDAFSKAGTMTNADAIKHGLPHLSPSQQPTERDRDLDDPFNPLEANALDYAQNAVADKVAPLKKNGKTPKKQLQKRAAVKRAVPTPVPGLSYGRGMSHQNRLDFLNNPTSYNAQVDRDRKLGRVPSSKVNALAALDSAFNDGSGIDW